MQFVHDGLPLAAHESRHCNRAHTDTSSALPLCVFAAMFDGHRFPPPLSSLPTNPKQTRQPCSHQPQCKHALAPPPLPLHRQFRTPACTDTLPTAIHTHPPTQARCTPCSWRTPSPWTVNATLLPLLAVGLGSPHCHAICSCCCCRHALASCRRVVTLGQRAVQRSHRRSRC